MELLFKISFLILASLFTGIVLFLSTVLRETFNALGDRNYRSNLIGFDSLTSQKFQELRRTLFCFDCSLFGLGKSLFGLSQTLHFLASHLTK
jgi:hypothetical protein